MKKLRDIFKKSEKKSKPSVSRIKAWIEDGLAKGYSLEYLRERLIRHGLEKEAVNLIHVFPHPHKTYGKKYSTRKINTILLLACGLMIGLIITFATTNESTNFVGTGTGGHTQVGEGNALKENTIIVDTTPHYKKVTGNESMGNTIQIVTGGIISEEENPGAIVNVNFGENVGKVREDFYGNGDYNMYLSNLSYITLLNGTKVSSNSEWTRGTVLNANLGIYRSFVLLSKISTGEGTWNNSETSVKLTNIDAIKDEVEWAYENNITIILSLADMPDWLADKTSGYCNASTMYSDLVPWSTCNPSNYSKWGSLVVNFTNYVTNYGRYNNVIIEVWNEPNEVQSWLNNLTTNNPIKSVEYNKLFNATLLAIQDYNPSIKVIGPATHIYGIADTILWQNFMGNFSGTNAIFSFHYISTDNEGQTVLNTIFTACSTYNFNCSIIYNDEWKHKNITEQNITSNWGRWSENIAVQFIDFLKYPANLSNLLFPWTYYSANIRTPPLSAIYEPQLNGLLGNYLPPYNITKNFAHYHSVGSMVVKSNSSSDNIKVVASKKDDSEYITVINTGSEVDVGLNLYGKEISQIRDLETNETYNVIDGGVYIGPLDQYRIRYFVCLNNPVYTSYISNITDNASNITNEILEQCDDSYLSTITCEDLGYTSGILSYKSGCILDTSRCTDDSSYEAEMLGPVSRLSSVEDNENNSSPIIKNSLVANTLFYFLVIVILILMLFIVIMLIKIKKVKRSQKH